MYSPSVETGFKRTTDKTVIDPLIDGAHDASMAFQSNFRNGMIENSSRAKTETA